MATDQGRDQLRSTIDAITDAALPLATGVGMNVRDRARVQVEIADAVVALLDTKAQNGYTDAFYAVASMIGVPAMPTSPRDAWENEIEPRLRKLIDKAGVEFGVFAGKSGTQERSVSVSAIINALAVGFSTDSATNGLTMGRVSGALRSAARTIERIEG